MDLNLPRIFHQASLQPSNHSLHEISLLDQPYLPAGISVEQLQKPIQSLVYLREHIPLIVPGSAPQLLRPLLEAHLLEYKEKINKPSKVVPNKKPPLNAFLLFRMIQSMHLTYSPSGRSRSGQVGPKILSKLISFYWRLLLGNERDEWYLLADDLKLIREINRNDASMAIAQCAVVASKFSARPYTPPSARRLQGIDGKIGARLRLPSLVGRSNKHLHILGELRPMIEARLCGTHPHDEGGNAVAMEGPTLAQLSQVSCDSNVANAVQPRLPPISELIGRNETPRQ